MDLKEILFGKPIRTVDEQQEKITPLPGIPILGLDALASAAYGPEAALTVLLPLGVVATAYIGPITLLIILLLVVVSISYRQTIAAYPQGGGSFTVAKENLGQLPGLLAASALSIDYVLNVAVAISAGVGALVSAIPLLLPHTLSLCMVILALLTIVNLRGVRSAGVIFMFPTYVFVLCLGITIVIGIVRILYSSGHPVPIVPPLVRDSTHAATAWLLIRAFASGCTALTGIEAVSNAVPIFQKPAVILARRTLSIIMILLAVLLAGIAFLSHSYGISAMPQGQAGYQSILSQIVGTVAGRGIFYYVSMSAILTVLALSANTSFADFPRVCRILALNEFLPAGFAHRGRRLVYSNGILILTIVSGTLLVAFGGITDRLIPLFAVGAFTAFTLSQLGMVVHWHRVRGPHFGRSFLLNALGALATAATLIIIAISKFMEGAWLTIIVMPPLILMFLGIRKRYKNIERETAESGPLDTTGMSAPIIVIPVERLDRIARKALRLALALSEDIYVVQILVEQIHIENLSDKWTDVVEKPYQKIGHRAPQLIVLKSSYREFFDPLVGYVRRLASDHPDRSIAVIVPELVQRKWYHFLIPHRATLIKQVLLLRGGPQIVIIDVPWYLREEK
ncbi:MAG: APC family permease, partial [Syntrophales bacterium]